MPDTMLIAMITNFINRLKKVIKLNSLEYYLDKEYDENKNIKNIKNWKTFKKIQRKTGLMRNDYLEKLEEVILKLNITNYCDGPSSDDKPERGHDEVWFFGIEFLEEELYLKFVVPDSNKPEMICWSFHEPEYKMKYKYK